MAESDNDSFILIEQQCNNVQLTRSPKTDSLDQWSEISVPSVKSINSIQKPVNTQSAFSVFSGTYLQSQPPMIPGLNNNNNGTNSDKGYYLINTTTNTTSQENVAIFSSNSTTNDDNAGNANHINNVNPNSIGSVGSRVPFSWAEITKIQPQFHNENNKEVHKPKVFECTPKILTRHRAKKKINNQENNNKPKIINNDSNSTETDNSNPMPAIPESDPFATKTKSEFGRRVRKSGKRGSRLKYPNGRKGSKKNWRKKYQK